MIARAAVFLLAVGLVAALSGGTTRAELGDLEVSDSNSFRAGSVDIRIGWNQSRNGTALADRPPVDNPGEIFDVHDIQPGETGEATLNVKSVDNPAYLWFRAEQTGNSENNRTDSERGGRVCTGFVQLEEADELPAERSGGDSVEYRIEDLDGSLLELEAPQDNELGENGRTGTDRFELRLDGSPDDIKIEVDSRTDGTDYLELAEGESGLAHGRFKVTFVSAEKTGEEYIVTVEVEASSSTNSGVDGLLFEPCGKLAYYQVDLVRGEVIENLSEENLYGSRIIRAVHGTTFRNVDTDRQSRGSCFGPNRFNSSKDRGTIDVEFSVREGCNETVTLASYEKPSGDGFTRSEADQQVLVDYVTRQLGPGDHRLTVALPSDPTPDNSSTGGSDTTNETGELGDELLFEIWHDDGDNIYQEDEQLLFNGTAHQLGESDLGDGRLIDADPGTPTVEGFTGSKYLGFRWTLPDDASCDVQTDSKEFLFEFAASQERHNPDRELFSWRYMSDEESSPANTFRAGEFERCSGGDPAPVCGPVLQPGTGNLPSGDRNYTVENRGNSVKFDLEEPGLGEEGRKETEIFNLTVAGSPGDTLYASTKAGSYTGTAMVSGTGNRTLDSSGLWNITLLSSVELENRTEYSVQVESDSEEGNDSPALSNIEFFFCAPIERRPYYQVDLAQGEPHVPAPGRVDPTLFMALLSDREDGRNDLNPSLLDDHRKPDRLTLVNRSFDLTEETATVTFDISEGSPVKLSMSTYLMPGPYAGFNSRELGEQRLYDSVTRSFGKGRHTLSVELPGGRYPAPKGAGEG